jgi:DNA-binding transcriptional MerR regulator
VSAVTGRCRIGEVAQRLGITPRTIRYYEERGLLPSTSQDQKGRHRLYDENDVARLQEIIRLRDGLGLTLDDLKELIEAEEARAALRNELAETVDDARRMEIVEAALHYIERQIALVEARQETLASLRGDLVAKRRMARTRLAQLRRSRSGEHHG